MKLNIQKTIRLKFDIDSSEAIMFCQGGRMDYKFEKDDLDEYKFDFSELSKYNDVIISFQMTDKGRFDWITKEAMKARQASSEDSQASFQKPD